MTLTWYWSFWPHSLEINLWFIYSILLWYGHTPSNLLTDNPKKTLSSTPNYNTWFPTDWKHSPLSVLKTQKSKLVKISGVTTMYIDQRIKPPHKSEFVFRVSLREKIFRSFFFSWSKRRLFQYLSINLD